MAFSRSDAMRASRSDLECGGVTPEDRRYSERSDSTDALRLLVPLVVAAGVLWTMRCAVAAGVAWGHGVAGADERCAPDARGEGDASREGGGVCVVARG